MKNDNSFSHAQFLISIKCFSFSNERVRKKGFMEKENEQSLEGRS
jgi:hypothetical protein